MPESTPSVDGEKKQASQAEVAAHKALDLAGKLKSQGQLRKAFLECQAVLIDHSHNLSDSLSARIHHMMARISLAQDKKQRAEKYLKRALSLDPALPDMDRLMQEQLLASQQGKPEQALSVSLHPPSGKSEDKASLSGGSLPDSASVQVPEPAVHADAEPEPQPEPLAQQEPDSHQEVQAQQAAVAKAPVVQSVNGRLAWVASFWSRAAAFAVDTVLVAVLISVMVLLSSLVLGFGQEDLIEALTAGVSNLIVVFLLFVFFLLVYSTVFARFGGQTLGKILFGLRTVRLDGHSLKTSNALLRALGMLLSALPGLAGFMWAAFDLNKRAWHDRIGKTLVVKITPPADSKRQELKTEVSAHP